MSCAQWRLCDDATESRSPGEGARRRPKRVATALGSNVASADPDPMLAHAAARRQMTQVPIGVAPPYA